MTIDTHVHLYDPTRPEGVPWPPRDTPIYRRTLSADCRAVARPQGVDGVVVVEASERIADNGWVLEEADRDPFVKALVARLEPGAPEFAAELAHYAADPRVRGIRFWGDRTPAGAGRGSRISTPAPSWRTWSCSPAAACTWTCRCGRRRGPGWTRSCGAPAWTDSSP